MAQIPALLFTRKRLLLGRWVILSLGVYRCFQGAQVSLQALKLQGWTLETEAEHACGDADVRAQRKRCWSCLEEAFSVSDAPGESGKKITVSAAELWDEAR